MQFFACLYLYCNTKFVNNIVVVCSVSIKETYLFVLDCFCKHLCRVEGDEEDGFEYERSTRIVES